MTDRRTLLSRYGSESVPRYTSYPSANIWPARDAGFAERVLGRAARPLSLYVHVPFCRSLCLYCGCNMLVTRDQPLVERYLAALDKEVERAAALTPGAGEVVQVHLGGGTPTYLDPEQLGRVWSSLKRRFRFAGEVEAGIEIHPAVTSFEHVDALAALGFNRISMGVQDFDPEVQRRVRRIQSFEQTRDLIERARSRGFTSVNVDLMYGLPLQTAERFEKTLDRVVELSPDRIALFGYAHVPKMKKHQSLIVVDELPGPEERLALLLTSIRRLEEAGYVYVGLDHFAKRDDELCRARSDGSLRRNFMGYTTCADSDVLAFGPSSISEVRGAFLQNERDVRAWASLVERGVVPVVRGYDPTPDDDLRRDVIQQLFCRLAVDLDPAQARALAPELERLATLAGDGLVVVDGGHIRVTAEGQLFLRNVAAVFDAWLAPPGQRAHSTAV